MSPYIAKLHNDLQGLDSLGGVQQHLDLVGLARADGELGYTARQSARFNAISRLKMSPYFAG